MAITLEQVEKLREKAEVSYDEARAALEAADGDLLSALIGLENQGKVKAPPGNGYYRSKEAPASEKEPEKNGGAEQERKSTVHKEENFGSFIKRVGVWCGKLLHKGNVNGFQVVRGGEVKATFPVIVLVILLLFFFWVTVPLLIIGLFFGFRYRFTGPDLGRPSVNNAMDEVAKTADQLKNAFTEEK